MSRVAAPGSYGAGRARLATAALAPAALGLGALLVYQPRLAFALLVVIPVGALLALAPFRFMPAILLAGISILPSILLELSLRGVSVPLGGQATIVVAVAGAMVVRVVLRGERILWPRRPGVVIAIYLGMLVVSAVVGLARNIDEAGLGSQLGRQLSYGLAFLIGANAYRSRMDARRRIAALRGMAYVLVAGAVASILFWASTADLVSVPGLATLFEDAASISEYGGRSIFPFVQDSPNVVAVIFVVLASFVAASLLTERRHRALGVVTAVVCLGAVLTTQSRSGLLAAAAAMVAFIAALPAARGARRRAAAGALIVAALGVGGYQLFPSDRDFTAQSTLLNREQIWLQARATIGAHPILGSGYHFSVQDPFIQDVADPAYGTASVRRNSIHSDYLGYMVDAGLLGIGALLAVMWSLLQTGLRGRRQGEIAAALGTGLLCVVAALTVSMVFNAVTQSAVAAIALWLVAGLTAAASKGAA